MTPLVKLFTGAHAMVAALNRLRENVRERTPIAGDGIRIDQFMNGFRIHSTAKAGKEPGESSSVEMMLVHSIVDGGAPNQPPNNHDYLLCLRPGEAVLEDGSNLIPVAMPPEFTRDLWTVPTGYTYAMSGPLTGDITFSTGTRRVQRVITLPDVTESVTTWTEDVYPPYKPGSAIYAAKPKSGTRRVTIPPAKDILYADVTPGRAWKIRPVTVFVCVKENGVFTQRRMDVEGSDTYPLPPT